jgi:hypothetical protein
VFTLLGLKYTVLAFTAVVGVLQAVAAYNNLRGMLFFRYRLTGYIFGALAMAAPLVVFFTWNYHFPIGIIQGSEQTGLFCLATLAAIIFTAVLSSLIHIRFANPQASQAEGLDAVRETSFFRAFWGRITRKR